MSAGRKKNECRNERYPVGVESESHGRAEIRAWTPQIGQDYCRHHRRIIEGAARDEKLKAERHKAKRPTLIFFAQSKYDGYCRDKDCGGRWSKGEACYWDSQTREVFCVECGELMSPY